MRLAIIITLSCISAFSSPSNLLNNLPVSFEPGQNHAYVASGRGYALTVSPAKISIADLQINFVNGRPDARVEGLDQQPGISNYFLGNHPSQWRTNVPRYGRVAVRGVYPGIDLLLYAKEGAFEYDWIVAPGADPSNIRMKFQGGARLHLDASGDVVFGKLRQRKPVVLQAGRPIDGRYVKHGNEVAFAVAKYDASKELVIDPTLIYSTYLGPNPTYAAPPLTDEGSAVVFAVAVDSSGNAYVTGSTDQGLVPINPSPLGSSGVFVIKVNPQGALVYSTFLGGNGGFGTGIALDSNGNAYVTGTPGSNFPLVSPIQTTPASGFVAKLNAQGNALVYSTYISGTCQGVGVDPTGAAYITGGAVNGFPTVNAIQSIFGGGLGDAFVAKINPQGNAFVYASYLGGSGFDQGQGIAVDAGGNAYVTGFTEGGIPTANALQPVFGGALQDAFVSKISPQGALVYSTYLGGSGNDRANAIAVDATGSAYVAGSTTGAFPLANALQPTIGGDSDAFVTKINPQGSALVYSTYLGGSGTDKASGIAVDSLGNAHVTGSAGTGFPLLTPIQTSGGAFVSTLNAAGSALTFSTYLQAAGYGIATDASSNTYVVGAAGRSNFPLLHPIQGVFTSSQDGFLTAISSAAATAPILNITMHHAGQFVVGDTTGDSYTITVSSVNVSGPPTSGIVTVTENPPSGLTVASMSGLGWTCGTTSCTRSDALAGGNSYQDITVMVKVALTATSPQLNQATVSGGGSVSATTTDATLIFPPSFSVGPDLVFGVMGNLITGPQTRTVNFQNNAPGHWSAVSDIPNVTVSPTSGIGSGTFTVTATSGPSGMITVTDPDFPTSPVKLRVTITVMPTDGLGGSFDTPVDNTTGVTGAIAVTGWALGSIQVTKLDIWRERVGNEPVAPNGLVYIGDAVFVAGARNDIADQYYTFPMNDRAGWGYLMLTSGLPNNGGSPGPGNGTYKLHAIAHNLSGGQLDFGTKTITVDNAHANKPFGTLDTPNQGATVSGSQFVNFGWALTQNPNCIPTDGSTITVTVDGVTLGHPVYNQPRTDIATAFPGLCNSAAAVGYFFIDTTQFTNGLHAIGWTVYDNVGHGDGIGSRFLTVLNTGSPVAAPDQPIEAAADGLPREVQVEELGSIELHSGAKTGYLLARGERRPLPAGSSLRGGVFRWQLAPGFLGKYDLVLVRPDGEEVRVRVEVHPKKYRSQDQ